jgi:hypothetical protein
MMDHLDPFTIRFSPGRWTTKVEFFLPGEDQCWANLVGAEVFDPLDEGGVVSLYLRDTLTTRRLRGSYFHWVRADGTCCSCPEWHGWILDLAQIAGWQCPALDAAVTARSGADL